MMNYCIQLFSLFTFAIICNTKEFDYCSLSPKHTMCVYDSVGPACTKYKQTRFRKVIPNEEQQKYILDWHNKIRRKIAKGEETRGMNGQGLPPASDMHKMEWDNELAESAQRLAAQCIFDHDCTKCKGVPNGRYWAVGQNLASGGNYRNRAFRFNLIELWYEREVDMFSSEYISPARYNYKYGHFTQVVWWKSRAVGCGATVYNTGHRTDMNLIVCNYGPIGNGGEEMYAIGKPCTRCAPNTTCDDGLCVLDPDVDRMQKLQTDDYFYVHPEVHNVSNTLVNKRKEQNEEENMVEEDKNYIEEDDEE